MVDLVFMRINTILKQLKKQLKAKYMKRFKYC